MTRRGDYGVDPAEEARYYRLRQPGSRARLLAIRLEDIVTIGDLVRVLDELDQLHWMEERGLTRDQ
jgi:hypothetical protein